MGGCNMPLSPNYTICEEIYQDNRIELFKGFITANHVPVIIKKLKKEAVNLIEVSRIINEFKITQSLAIDGVIRPIELVQGKSCFAIVMEDKGTVPLKKYTGSKPVKVSLFVEIAVQLADILSRVHSRGIIHGSLKPDNILINPDTLKVYITGFDQALIISSDKGFENPIPLISDCSYEYISPEQTGRLIVALDWRSDLYSLGVVFYEMLTGRLPITAQNEVEWMHAHITSKPLKPDLINPQIPAVVSEIVIKLLEKNADKRYQSTLGLLHDIEECRKQLNNTGKIDVFEIGKKDVNYSFQIPSKLYGRSAEEEQLKSAFDRVCNGSKEIVFVSGSAGTGKTVLINQIIKPLVLGKGYYISGKVDQLRQNIPYAPFIDAFRSLIMQLMTENEKRLSNLKKTILQSLRKNCSVMTEFIPELEYIIGKQPPADILSPREAENRFSIILREFIGIFTCKNHPLVIFLDDLQWVDTACIKLINDLINDIRLNSLLLIFAYRHDEITEDHLLNKLLRHTNSGQSNITHIHLTPLDWKNTNRMIADALHSDLENVALLSEILYRESGGNPFFLKQLLRMIYDKKLLYFNVEDGSWKWDINTTQNLNPGNDVQQLFLKKMLGIPKETLEIMKYASCIGSRFDLQTLAEVLGKTVEETIFSLIPAVHEGFILPVTNQKENSEYRFLHDKVQQSVYSLINENEKKEKHLAIGRLLLQRAKDENKLNEAILSIMDHFSRSLDLVNAPKERYELAEYNLLAGRKVKTSAAYDSALQYFRSGRILLSDNCWDICYKLSYDLYLEQAQAEYLSGNTDIAEKLFDIVSQNASDEVERARICCLKVLLYANTGKYDEAVCTGLKALNNLGMRIPVNPNSLDYIKELLKYKWNMRNKKIEDLISLPEMKDPVQKMIAELLSRLCSVTMTTHPDLYSYIIIKTGNHATRYGNSYMASVGYFGYSFTMGIIMGDYKTGGRFAKVCIYLAKKYGHSAYQCIIYFVIGAFIIHWNDPLSYALDYMEKAILYGKEAGDVLIIGYANCMIMEIRYLLGTSITEMKRIIKENHETALMLKHDNLAINTAIYERIVSTLQGGDNKSLSDGIAEYEDQKFVDFVQGDKTSLATYYIHKVYLHYLAGDYKKALEAAGCVKPLFSSILGFMMSAEYYFYYSLTIIAILNKLPWKDKIKYWKILQNNIRKMKKWAESCKENFLDKYLLLKAEEARLKNNNSEAMKLYNMAIESTQKNGFVQAEALANELAAKFYLSFDMNEIAQVYMRDAYRAYKKWGALSKCRQLHELYSEWAMDLDLHITKDGNVKLMDNLLRITLPDNDKAPDKLDTYLLEKTVKSISNKTDINKILKNFLELTVKYVGADKGYLILYNDGNLFVKVGKDSNSKDVVISNIPLEQADDLSKAVVRYVVRTHETVIVNCGEQEKIFDYDPYIAKSNSKSIGCIPLIFQQAAVGVLYFENSYIPGVFTYDLLDSLKFLTAQMAYVERMQTFWKEAAVSISNTAELPYLIEPLTDREMEVLELIVQGMSNKEIADSLNITVNTVKGYVKNIYQKLGVNRRVQVVTRAKELNLIK